MGRKNKRKQSAYYRKLRIKPKRLMRKSELCSSLDNRVTVSDSHTTVGVHTAEKEHRAMAGRETSRGRTPQQGRTPQRGEIWFAEFGFHPGTSVQGGCRPALVISNDVANRFSATVTVIPMTTRMKKEYLPTHVVMSASDANIAAGQHFRRSMLLAEQVTTIGKDALVSCVGRLKAEKLKEAESALLVQMNITNTDFGSGECPENKNSLNSSREEMAFSGSKFRGNPE